MYMFFKRSRLAPTIISTLLLFPSGSLFALPSKDYKERLACEIVGKKDGVDKNNSSSNKGKIVGKITDTAGKNISNVTISIQEITHGMTYGNLFEDMTTTDKKGKFTIQDIAPGNYIVRATPSDNTYLPNDKIGVKVKNKKKKNIKIKLSSASEASSGYVGSAICLGCHPDQKDWQDTAHAKTLQTPDSDTVVAPFDGSIITTDDNKVTFMPFTDGDGYKVTLYDLTNPDNSVTYTIARTHGGVSVAGKQRYQVKIGNSHYILPIQYNNRNVDKNDPAAAWVSYNPGTWYNDDGTLIARDENTAPNPGKSFEQNCEGCHVTGLSITKNSAGEFVSDSKELGISCESCHGPGEKHVSEGGGNSVYTVNPEYLATDRGNEVCGQCHARVKNKNGENGADFETEYPAIINGGVLSPYRAGEDLNNYIEETDGDGNPTAGYWNNNDSSVVGEDTSENNHSKRHHQQYQDFIRSIHYNKDGQKCYTCHEAHGKGEEGTPQLLTSNDNKACTVCHDDFEETTTKKSEIYYKHSSHEYNSSDRGGNLCTGCHMPKTAKTAVDNDISSHVFDIIKPQTSKAMADYNSTNGEENSADTVITNSCYGCHSTDADYGTERWNEWENNKEENDNEQ